jgi:uncharacterized RDD family membrane protein YckC
MKINIKKSEKIENVSNNEIEEIQYAGFFLRVGATLIDNFVIFALIFFTFVVFDPINGLSEEEIHTLNNVLQFGLIILTIFLWVKWDGSTPGKKLLKIKIVDAKTLGKLSLGQSILRYIGYIPSFMLFGIGILMILFTKKKQGLHDKLANTIVIKNR